MRAQGAGGFARPFLFQSSSQRWREDTARQPKADPFPEGIQPIGFDRVAPQIAWGHIVAIGRAPGAEEKFPESIHLKITPFVIKLP